MKQKTKNVNESAVSKDKLVSFVKALHLCPAEKPETRSFRLQTSQLPPSSATHKMVIQIQEWRHSNVLWQKHTQTTISNSSRKHFNSKNRFKRMSLWGVLYEDIQELIRKLEDINLWEKRIKLWRIKRQFNVLKETNFWREDQAKPEKHKSRRLLLAQKEIDSLWNSTLSMNYSSI